MSSRTEMARQALRAAMQLRRHLSLPREAAVNAFDAAQMVGIDVRFIDAPSLEGMFVRDPGLRILLPCLKHRPRGRVLYSCAHEIGHQQFGHGTRADLYLEDQSIEAHGDEEFLANAFAGHFLMPRAAVLNAYDRRGASPRTATPTQHLFVSAELGVAYEALLTHLCVAFSLISRDDRARLGKETPKRIKSALIGRDDEPVLVIADVAWKWSPIDAECGDLVALPSEAAPKCSLLRHEFDHRDFSFYRASTIGSAVVALGNHECHLRISRRHYVGPYVNRYLPDPDEC